MVSQSECAVTDVTRHESHEPCTDCTRSSTEEALACRCNRKYGQCTVNSRHARNGPPSCIVDVAFQERVQCNATQRQCPTEQRRSRIDGTDRIGTVHIDDEVTVLCKDVVDGALHVPRVRTTGHVPFTGSCSVHCRNHVPHDADSQSGKECPRDGDSIPVLAPPKSCLTVFTAFRTLQQTSREAEVKDSSIEPEEDCEPRQAT